MNIPGFIFQESLLVFLKNYRISNFHWSKFNLFDFFYHPAIISFENFGRWTKWSQAQLTGFRLNQKLIVPHLLIGLESTNCFFLKNRLSFRTKNFMNNGGLFLLLNFEIVFDTASGLTFVWCFHKIFIVEFFQLFFPQQEILESSTTFEKHLVFSWVNIKPIIDIFDLLLNQSVNIVFEENALILVQYH